MAEDDAEHHDEPVAELSPEADGAAEAAAAQSTDAPEVDPASVAEAETPVAGADAAEAEPAAEPIHASQSAPESQPEPEPVIVVEPPLAQTQVAPRPTRRRLGPVLRRLALIVLLVVVFVPPLSVIVFRIAPVPITELMVQRLVEGYGMDYQWRPLSQISPALTEAAVASEDARFCSHHGFDFEAMQKAMAHNERRPNKIKGGSTISQQTAKNVFLWPGRSYLRKGIEAWYTVLIETLWGKRRIMEVYLNVAEFGQGVYGAQAAAQHFYHEDASDLSSDEAAHLIAVLPRPLKWTATAPGHYVAKRSGRIDRAIGTIREDGLAACVGR